MIHEIRVGQFQDDPDSDRRVNQLPQAAILQREYWYKNTEQDPDSRIPQNPRQVPAAPSGGLGAR